MACTNLIEDLDLFFCAPGDQSTIHTAMEHPCIRETGGADEATSTSVCADVGLAYLGLQVNNYFTLSNLLNDYKRSGTVFIGRQPKNKMCVGGWAGGQAGGWMDVRLYVCMHACIHACMHVHMHVCMYLYFGFHRAVLRSVHSLLLERVTGDEVA